MMKVVVMLSVYRLIVSMFYVADSNVVATEGVQLIGNV